MGGDQQDGRTPGDGAAQDCHPGGRDLTRWTTPAGRALARAAGAVSRRLGPHAALVLTLLLGATVATALTAATGVVYESVVEADGVAALDHPMLEAAIGLRSPGLDAAATGFTHLGGTAGLPILAALAVLVLSLARRSWMPALLIAAAGGGSTLMTVAGKQLTGRARPPLADAVPPYEYSASFPSGHALNSIVVAGIVAYVLVLRQHTARARVLTVLAAGAFAVAMGLSRVFLGHHWFTDVLGAWTLGLAWLALVITAHRLYLTVRRRGSGRSARQATGPAPAEAIGWSRKRQRPAKEQATMTDEPRETLGSPTPEPGDGLRRDPEEWVTGDEPMTDAQRSYLDTLAREAGEELPADLTKAQASEHIDRLQGKSGRLKGD